MAIEKWIDLSGLPKFKYGDSERISWIDSVGYDVNFQYDDIIGNITILDYNNNNLTIQYKNIKYNINRKDFYLCAFGEMLNKKTSKFKKDIGYNIITDKKNLTILKLIYITEKSGLKRKAYEYICNKCGYVGIMLESSFLKDTCCPACCNIPKVIVPEINSIVSNSETQWMIQYFQGGYDEAKLYTARSSKKVDLICPNCGKIKNKIICDLYYTHSLGCNCSDGLSYPNKFIYAILNQLKIFFNSEKTFEWANKKLYDIYINNLHLIIENHGGQHYKDIRRKGARTLEEEQANDKYKKELALQNGIKYYIELDCRKSELEWIKDSVMNSKLPNLLNFKEEDIDWLECEAYALKNIAKEVCDYKKANPNILVSELMTLFSISESTIRNYLHKGNSLNWCIYEEKHERKISAHKKSLKYSKRVLCTDNDKVFYGAQDVENQSQKIFGKKMNRRNICAVCNGTQKSYYGYHFQYLSEEEYQYRLKIQKEVIK